MTKGVCLVLKALFNGFKGRYKKRGYIFSKIKSIVGILVEFSTYMLSYVCTMCSKCVHVLIYVNEHISTNFCLGTSYPLHIKICQVLVVEVVPV